MIPLAKLPEFPLASYLARKIFESCDSKTSGDKTQRIAFKGGKYGKKETDLGGLCEAALMSVILEALRDSPSTVAKEI